MKKLTAVFFALALIISVLCAVPVYAEEMPVFEDTVYDIQADGYTTVYDETHNPITTATPGTQLFFSAEGTAPDGKYFTDEFLIDGNETVKGEYLMPEHNITVSAILAERTDVTIDISDGSVKEMSEKEYLCSIDMLPQLDGEKPSPEITMLDFNSDGTADAKITQFEPVAPSVEPVYTIQLLPEAVGKLAQKFTVSPESGPYKSITFTLNASAEPSQTYYTVTAAAEKGGSADGGFVAAEGATAKLTATPDKWYAFDGWYEGNTKVSSSPSYTFTVTRDISLTARFCALPAKITASNESVLYGENEAIIIKVYDIENNPLGNTEVICKFNGKSENKTTNSNGETTYRPNKNLAPKKYKLTVECGEAETTSNYTVKKAIPILLTNSSASFKLNVKTKKLSVTLKNNNRKAIKSAKLTISVNGKKYSARTNSKGLATFKITKLTKRGTYTATVKYNGNKYYKTASTKIKIRIK